MPRKTIAAVVAGGAAVAIGPPLIAGADPTPEPASPPAQVRAAAEMAPAPAPHPAPAPPPAPAAEAQGAAEHTQAITKSVPVDNQAQINGYYCGPAAARIALPSHSQDLPDQMTLAEELGTTTNGTDHISQITNWPGPGFLGDLPATSGWPSCS